MKIATFAFLVVAAAGVNGAAVHNGARDNQGTTELPATFTVTREYQTLVSYSPYLIDVTETSTWTQHPAPAPTNGSGNLGTTELPATFTVTKVFHSLVPTSPFMIDVTETSTWTQFPPTETPAPASAV